VNEFAAVPSMHVGWNLLLALGLFLSFRNPVLRGLALLLPPAMIVSTVATGNHYLLDAPLGIMTAVTGLIIALQVRRYWPQIEKRLPEWLRNLDGPPAEAGPVAQAR
jgi:membrane-associated phospholipid phosphatase